VKLFLAAEAVDPNTIKKLESFVGGFNGKRIAYIPTAANADTLGWESWKLSDSWNIVQGLGAEATPVQLEDYKDKSALEMIRGKDIIWFAGGYAGYLMYWVRRTQLDKYLPEMLTQGSVYVGSSAGSMIASRDLNAAEWYIGESEPGAGAIPGLGLVDFDIYPHFDDAQMAEIKTLYKGKKMYLLKNGEEVIVEDGKITVVGEERVVGV
jgi:dipeptidase E